MKPGERSGKKRLTKLPLKVYSEIILPVYINMTEYMKDILPGSFREELVVQILSVLFVDNV